MQERKKETSQEPLMSRDSLGSPDIRQRYSQESSISVEPDNDVILNVTQLTGGANDETQLQNLDILIKEEEILCILGENRAGKSTLLNILAGLESPTGGTIKYHELNSNPLDLLELTGFCSQRSNAFLGNTVDENLEFFALLKGVNVNIEEKRSQVGLTKNDGSMLVSTLPADKKVMMNLAIVLLSDPKIVMIEEPTTELDSSAIKVFGKLLKNLKTSEKKTIIFTTQNVRDTELADSVAILEKERNFTGTLTEVKRKILKGLYILIISIRDEESSREKIKKTVQEIVEKHIPRLTSLDSTTDSVLKYKVSSSDNKIELSQLFTELGLLPQIQVSDSFSKVL